jgi:hypothetical protein
MSNLRTLCFRCHGEQHRGGRGRRAQGSHTPQPAIRETNRSHGRASRATRSGTFRPTMSRRWSGDVLCSPQPAWVGQCARMSPEVRQRHFHRSSGCPRSERSRRTVLRPSARNGGG